MSKEEEQAIKWLENTDFKTDRNKDINATETLLNLIEKQQKEIEEFKKDKKALVNNYNNVLEHFISKDKIKEKIKELKNDKNIVNSAYWDGEDDDYIQDYQIKVLQELLGDE